jgi:polyisoprenoid-binding protein YceI
MANWKIDTNHAFAEFSAKHLGISWVHGSMHNITGTVEFDPEKPEQAKFKGEIDTTTLNSGFEMRDNHLKGADFLNIEEFPKLNFESTETQIHGDHAHVKGKLTIKGVTKEVELEGTFNGIQDKPAEDGSVTTVAAFTLATEIDRRDFDMNWNVNLPGGGLLVGNEIMITVDIEAIRE